MDIVDFGSQGRSLPVACTLGPPDGRSRLLRWRRLHERATAVARLDGDHLEVRYRPGVGVGEELSELAAAEQACCTFAQWRVSTARDSPVLHVTAAPDALTSIAMLFDRAAPTRESE